MARAACAALALFALGVTDAAAQADLLVGEWRCVSEGQGLTQYATYNYMPDGRYVSRQRVIGPRFAFEGGGGGTWRLEGSTLYDTKLEGRIDRLVIDGVETPSSDPTFQMLQEGAQSNVNTTTRVELNFSGDALFAGGNTCQRASPSIQSRPS